MKKIILIGLLSFLVAAIWQLPLTFAKPYIEKAVKGLTMNGVSGTIWQGKTDSLRVANTNLEQVDWQVKPLSSLTSLSLKVAFNVDDPNVNAHGLAGITPSQNIILDNTQFELNANYLNKLQKYAKISGDIKGNIKHAEIYKDQKKLPKIKGIIDWKNAALSSPMKLPPGDYKAIITPVSGDLLIKLSSFEAPVELNGEIKVNKDLKYKANIGIKSTDKNIGPLLALLGKKQADGTVKLIKNGDINSLLK